MPADEPTSADDYLTQKSQLAKASLQRLRGEVLESLGRTADVGAWTARYPWPSLAAAAAAGLGAGVALGARSRQSPEVPTSTESTAAADGPAASTKRTAAAGLVHGLGVLTTAVLSAAAVAVAEALGDVVKETVRETIHPSEDSPT